MSILDKTYSGTTIKQLNIKELNILCDEIRDQIFTTVEKNGGHLSPNLGSVELIVALHYVFDIPSDKLIFDVGHQSYAHKILTGRLNEFSSIRKKGGLSGFPDPAESQADAFIAGHAGTSISAGLGFCRSRDFLKDDYYVVNLVGDASFFNGENLEALTSSVDKPNKYLVVLNDNGMSINKNNNGLYKFISKVTIRRGYYRFNAFLSRVFGKSFIGNFLRRIKRAIKRSLSVNTIMDNLGFKYVGRFDGHNLKSLIRILQDIKYSGQPTLLHVNTIKGKGYVQTEKDSSRFHGVSENMSLSKHYFSSAVSEILNRKIEKYPEIIAITAGMKDGVGLTNFATQHPNSFVDVGICEEFAVTLSAGMAKSGSKPIVFMYSTFMQRGYDQLIHDVCLQNLPVVFCIDRAGFVGSDGKTHQGLFDLSYLSHIPNLTVLSPKDVFELENMIEYALNISTPVAIRYPNGKFNPVYEQSKDCDYTKFEVIKSGVSDVLLAVGPRMIDLAMQVQNSTDKDLEIVNARVVKPLDCEYLDLVKDRNIITLEENSRIGGFGSLVVSYYVDKGEKPNVTVLGAKDEFISHASVSEQLEQNGLTVENILKHLK
ncbi:MAG: 1-deoxy-D-xylulose-5-phosphate synthase [Clostridiales bacterium]|nr:1-deoxy-D-xylulose-5-phosphate synthase [Clostridiales bacterium]